MSKSNAVEAALKNGLAESGNEFLLNVTAIEHNDNPRHEPSNIFEHDGYVLIGTPPDFDPEQWSLPEGAERPPSLVELATSKDLSEVKMFVEMIETHESNGMGARAIDVDSIVGLAAQIRSWSEMGPHGLGQLIPALVKNIGTEKSPKWSLVDGGRRCTAIMYLHAKDRLAIDSKSKGAPKKPYPAVIRVMDGSELPEESAFELSMALNLHRKNVSPLQEGMIYTQILSSVNPATGKKWRMKELHRKIGPLTGITYNTMRNRIALCDDYVPAKRDENGVIVRHARGLTDADRRKLVSGEMTATQAARKSLGETSARTETSPSSGGSGSSSNDRSESSGNSSSSSNGASSGSSNSSDSSDSTTSSDSTSSATRPATVSSTAVRKGVEIEDEFDRRRSDPTDEKFDEGYLAGLAFALGKTVKQVTKDSDARLKAASKQAA